jgi:hypothetical protein
LEVSGELHAPAVLSWGMFPLYILDRKLGDPRAGLDDREKRKFLIIPGIELRPFSRPFRSQPQYRLHLQASTFFLKMKITLIIVIVLYD